MFVGYECGLRRNISSIYLKFCLRQILETKWEYNQIVHQIFKDAKKVYDSFRRKVLCDIIIEFCIPMK